MSLKFIHTSDLHLGIKFNNKHFSLKEREKRREELWDTFDSIVGLTKKDKIPYLFIAGDLIQSDYLTFKNLKRIIQKFEEIKDTTKVIMSFGSNDPFNINSMFEYVDIPDNLYIIKNTESVQKLDFKDLSIYSLSWDRCNENESSQLIYDISVDENRINVLLLYCGVNLESKKLPINPDLIKNKFDYCALGSRHNYTEVKQNTVYPGTPEPLSFEETGEHGIIVGSLEKRNTVYEFLPLAKRKFIEREINIELTFGFNKILDLIKFSGDTFSNIKDYVKVNLKGVVNSNVSIEEVKKEAKQFFYYIEFEDNFVYKNSEDKKYDDNEFNIIESYKLQFENHHNKLEQQAFELGLEVLRKEKVVK